MPLLITIARAIPESVFTTVWTGDTCSTEVSHEIPEYVRVPVFNPVTGAAVPGTFQYLRKSDAWCCKDCGDNCAECAWTLR